MVAPLTLETSVSSIISQTSVVATNATCTLFLPQMFTGILRGEGSQESQRTDLNSQKCDFDLGNIVSGTDLTVAYKVASPEAIAALQEMEAADTLSKTRLFFQAQVRPPVQ